MWVGTEMFPRILNALEPPFEKQTKIAIVYQHNPFQADQLAQQLQTKSSLNIEPIHFERLQNASDFRVLFIIEPELHKSELAQWARQHKQLSFSPFPDALNAGFDISLNAQDRIQPYLHLKQIQQKQWHFKPFFIRISTLYEHP